jgi:uncharacterized protein (TIGR00299 family) protein
MRLAYFDCFAGISGDMILGALIDAGLEVETFQEALSGLHLSEYELSVARVQKGAFQATDVQVRVSNEVEARTLADIEAVVMKSELPDQVKNDSVAVFQRLVAVEASIHGTSPERAHLHEVGGTDAIVDVVGSLLALNMLGVEKVYSSRLPLGHGFVRCAHGLLPLPAPATLGLLKGVPVTQIDVEGELVTPTGAAIITSIAEGFGPFPQMVVQNIGYGAGTSEFPFPNLLRVLLGTLDQQAPAPAETVVLLETNLDDMNPEWYDHTMQTLFEAGALDVFLRPFYGKKNRPGTLLSVLCRPQSEQELSSIMLAETTTLGIRRMKLERLCLDRETIEVDTPYGRVRIKVAKLGSKIMNLSPEYDDCRRLAVESREPLKEVYAAAQAAAGDWRDSHS